VITCLVFCVFIFLNNRSRQDKPILSFYISSKLFISAFSVFNFIKAVLHYCLPYINRYCQLNHTGVHNLRDWQSIGVSILYCQGNVYCTVLYCTDLYCPVLYCTVVYCTVLTVLYCTVLSCTVLYYTVLYCTVLNCTVLYCTTLYCVALYCTVLYCAVLYCTVLY